METLQELRDIMTDEIIDRSLDAGRVPGGSSPRAWFLPHNQSEQAEENIRDVVRVLVAEVINRTYKIRCAE